MWHWVIGIMSIISFFKCSLNTDITTINVMIAVAVTDTMKVTVNVITTTAPVDNPELYDDSQPVKQSKI